MKILHLTSSKKGGGGLFTINFSRYLNDSASTNDVLSFKDFLFKGFIKISFVVFYKLFVTLINVKFKKKSGDIKHISPSLSLWKLNLITDLISQYDMVIIHRFTNFLSHKEVLEILKTSTKSYILALDESLFTPYCNYTSSCVQYKTDCSNCPLTDSKVVKNIIRNEYKEISNLIANYDFSKTNTKILTANFDEQKKIAQSFWVKSNIKIESTILPYNRHMKKTVFENIFNKKIKSFEEKIIITVSALSNIPRKGFDIFLDFLPKFEIECERNKRNVVINIVTNENININIKSDYLTIIQHGLLNTINFEELLASSHSFLSFSRSDSGPFTLNICYYLKVLIFSFNVGVAPEILKKTNSIYISDIFESSSMLSITNKLFELDSKALKNKLNYKISNNWI